ncbi:hypothetical protein PKHYL_11670 [Psychrobacter sp. KH172YL61]|nr:hypothetical protein PKHYL_11670 [Psychrobacter sp. KH172YL61]
MSSLFLTSNSAVRAISSKALLATGKSSRLLGLSFLALSMAACNTIPKADTSPVLAEPNLPIEQAYGAFGDETVSTSEQPSIAGQRWQDFYSDERLKALIALGLENNKDFESARLAIEKRARSIVLLILMICRLSMVKQNTHAKANPLRALRRLLAVLAVDRRQIATVSISVWQAMSWTFGAESIA